MGDCGEIEQIFTSLYGWRGKIVLIFDQIYTKTENRGNIYVTMIDVAGNTFLITGFCGKIEQCLRLYRLNFAAQKWKILKRPYTSIKFHDILRFYPYKNMEDLQYYLAECFLIQKKYADARELYSKIVSNNHDKEFSKKAYWRLMLISDSYKQYRDFFTYADKVIKLYKSEPTDEFLEKVIFYSGYMAYEINDFNRSNILLGKLSENDS